MLLTIYDKAGAKRADVAASDSSTQSKEVQGDNVLALSFTHYAHIPLDVGDFTDYMGERYWLTERYTPSRRSPSKPGRSTLSPCTSSATPIPCLH